MRRSLPICSFRLKEGRALPKVVERVLVGLVRKKRISQRVLAGFIGNLYLVFSKDICLELLKRIIVHRRSSRHRVVSCVTFRDNLG